jgi:threonine dehydrogenase-like Zn-dependent dehydrogenase
MKALIIKDKIRYLSFYPKPLPKKGEVLIKVLLAGICNTDIEITKGYLNFKGVLGHEFVGIVEEGEEKSLIGKRVVGEINIGCGKCQFCRSNLKNHCPNRVVLGIYNKDGAFAQYLTLPLENIHILPKNLKDEEAVFVEPLAACIRILEEIKIRKEEKVIILGDGKLGQLMAQLLKLYCRDLLVIGKRKNKLEILKKFNIKGIELKSLRDIEADIIVECTGNVKGLDLALDLVKPKGTIFIKSTYNKRSSFDQSKAVVKEVKIIGSRCGPFKEAINLLKKKKIDPLPLISKVFPIEEGVEAFKYAMKREVLKVLLKIS